MPYDPIKIKKALTSFQTYDAFYMFRVDPTTHTFDTVTDDELADYLESLFEINILNLEQTNTNVTDALKKYNNKELTATNFLKQVWIDIIFKQTLTYYNTYTAFDTVRQIRTRQNNNTVTDVELADYLESLFDTGRLKVSNKQKFTDALEGYTQIKLCLLEKPGFSSKPSLNWLPATGFLKEVWIEGNNFNDIITASGGGRISKKRGKSKRGTRVSKKRKSAVKFRKTRKRNVAKKRKTRI
jgi:hypothetical protein